MKKIWAIGIIAVLVLAGIGLAMAQGERGSQGPPVGPPGQTEEKGPAAGMGIDVTAAPSGILVQSGRAGPFTVPKQTSKWQKVLFKRSFSAPPHVVWTIELPWPQYASAKIDYGIDYGYVRTGSFDARITSSHPTDVTYYVTWIAVGTV